jgi:hypothetical protein
MFLAVMRNCTAEHTRYDKNPVFRSRRSVRPVLLKIGMAEIYDTRIHYILNERSIRIYADRIEMGLTNKGRKSTKH